MVRLLICYSLLLAAPACASDVFQYRDANGRIVFSDTRPSQPHDVLDIQILNDYDWDMPPYQEAPQITTGRNKARRKQKTQRRYSLAELQDNCAAARYRYQVYRGKNSNSDWGTYKKRLGNLASKRDYWCSRVLKGK